MKLNVFRCRDGYLLMETRANLREAGEAHGPLDFVGEFHGLRLAPEVYARVIRQVTERGHALIGRDELISGGLLPPDGA